MSRGYPRIHQYVQTFSELEVINTLRQLAIANHDANHRRPRRAPSSAVRAAWSLPNTSTRRMHFSDNEVTDFDNGGVAIGLGWNEARASAEASFPSPAPSVQFSSTLPARVERTMTHEEVEIWARNHNSLFLKCLDASVSARSHATHPRTPLRNYPPNAGSAEVSHMVFPKQHLHASSNITPNEAQPPVPQCALAPIPQPFSPNTMVWEKMGIPYTQAAQSPASGKYLGNRSLTSNAREIFDLPDSSNCALFLTNIPVEATLHDTFSVIKTGAVFCLHINEPTAIHRTKAAKLVFMIPEAAAAFLAQINSRDGIVLSGHRIRGRYNRNGYLRSESNWQSRVLLLEGPVPLMTLAYWTSRFAAFSEFDLECYSLSLGSIDSRITMELRFARIDGQAQTCLQCIKTDPTLKNVVCVKYGTDPCGSSMS